MKHTACEMDHQAKTLAGNYLRTEGKLLAHLMEMRKFRVFTELNYSGVFDYCERALKLSRAQSYYFKSVAEKAELVPELKEAVVQGELSLSQARRIAPIITPENQEQWLADAKRLSQTALEERVAAVNPKAHAIKERIRPVAEALYELRVSVDPATQENLEALKDLLSTKLGRAAGLKDVIAWAAKVTREKFDPERKAARALSKKKISLGKSDAPTPGRHPIPAHVKNEVLLREGRRCCHVDSSGRRCAERRWLCFHHLRHVADGGLNTVDNLELRCSRHHAAAHRALTDDGAPRSQ